MVNLFQHLQKLNLDPGHLSRPVLVSCREICYNFLNISLQTQVTGFLVSIFVSIDNNDWYIPEYLWNTIENQLDGTDNNPVAHEQGRLPKNRGILSI